MSDVFDERELQSDLRAQEEDTYLVAVLSTYEGRAIFWSLLEMCGLYRSTFCGEEPLKTAFHEGRRSIGLAYYEYLRDLLPSDTLDRMRREFEKRMTRYQQAEENEEMKYE